MEKIEVRSYADTLVTDGNPLFVKGLVNRTNTWSKVMGVNSKFREKVEKGAFTRAIQNSPKIDFLSEHNKQLLLASTENGSLTIYEDDEGLQIEAQIANTSYANDIYNLIKEGLINYMSFGFKVIKDSWNVGNDGINQRTIEELMLTEVSVVRNPAYIGTEIEARGMELVTEVIPPENTEEGVSSDMSDLKGLKSNVLKKLQEKDITPDLQLDVIDVLNEVLTSLDNENEVASADDVKNPKPSESEKPKDEEKASKEDKKEPKKAEVKKEESKKEPEEKPKEQLKEDEKVEEKPKKEPEKVIKDEKSNENPIKKDEKTSKDTEKPLKNDEKTPEKDEKSSKNGENDEKNVKNDEKVDKNDKKDEKTPEKDEKEVKEPKSDEKVDKEKIINDLKAKKQENLKNKIKENKEGK